MKTTNKILALSAVVLVSLVTSNVKADGALLSPRAQGNQIHQIAGANYDVNFVAVQPSGPLLSPRARGNQLTRVAGTSNDPDLVNALQSQYGTPHSLQSAQIYQIAPMK